MRKLFLVLLSCVCCLLSFATELTDLGQGLAYLRVHSVADTEAALRKAVPGASALVLDLRYATANESSAAFLKAALAGRAANPPTFVLVSPATAAVLAPIIAASPVVTLGVPGSTPAAKVTVQADAAADRKAFDALDAGTELSKLITGKIEKERYDEATLVQEFKNGAPDPAPSAAADPTATKENAPAKETAPVVPTDRVLQRAVHLHRALLALRR